MVYPEPLVPKELKESPVRTEKMVKMAFLESLEPKVLLEMRGPKDPKVLPEKKVPKEMLEPMEHPELPEKLELREIKEPKALKEKLV